MAYKLSNLYAKMLLLYPRPYYERFSEGMRQTFNDIHREHGNSLTFTFWIFLETFIQIIKTNITYNIMQKRILNIILITLGLLIVPLVANFTIEGFNWSGLDFIFMGILLFCPIFAYDVISRKFPSTTYKIAAGLGALGGFLLMWVNAAVGIIGEGPINGLYPVIILAGLTGVLMYYSKPKALSNVLFTIAVAQALVPVVALIAKVEDFGPGVLQVFVLNSFFTVMFVVSGVLFRRVR